MANNNNRSVSDELRRARAKRKSSSRGLKILLALCYALILLVLVGVGVWAYFKYYGHPEQNVEEMYFETDGETMTEDGEPSAPERAAESISGTSLRRADQTYSFLVVGCDRAAWLSDVIMVAKYDVKSGKCTIMQIPRDTYVLCNRTLILDDNGRISPKNFTSGSGCKVNSVLWMGGLFAQNELNRISKLVGGADEAELEKICSESYLDIDADTLREYVGSTGKERSNIEYEIRMTFGMKYLSAMIKNYYGVPIDFCAQLNLDGFVNIVDAIGGVDVYVQEDMNYDDPYQDLHIHIKKGQQHLNGKDAEGFIRFRYGYLAADIARIDAQKIFMTAFIKKVMSISGVMNMNDIVREIRENLITNISVSDALYFGTNALDIDLNEIVMLTLPGTPQYIDNVSYYLGSRQAIIEYVNEYLNVFESDLDDKYFFARESASINTSTAPLTAGGISDEQPQLGFIH